MLGVYGDKIGQDFRKKYLARFPGIRRQIMGLVYTGNGYDIVQYLEAVLGGDQESRRLRRQLQVDPRKLPIAASAA